MTNKTKCKTCGAMNAFIIDERIMPRVGQKHSYRQITYECQTPKCKNRWTVRK